MAQRPLWSWGNLTKKYLGRPTYCTVYCTIGLPRTAVVSTYDSGCLKHLGMASSWNYLEKGPGTWPELYPNNCNGSSQSPIDLTNRLNTLNGCKLTFSNYNLPFSGYWENNGQTIEFVVENGSGAVISGPCLENSTYQLIQVQICNDCSYIKKSKQVIYL